MFAKNFHTHLVDDVTVESIGILLFYYREWRSGRQSLYLPWWARMIRCYRSPTDSCCSTTPEVATHTHFFFCSPKGAASKNIMPHLFVLSCQDMKTYLCLTATSYSYPTHVTLAEKNFWRVESHILLKKRKLTKAIASFPYHLNRLSLIATGP